MTGDISYKTHILVGVRPSGMTVLADWPYVPKQSEVQREIEKGRNGYVTYVLCTPTSIMPAIMPASGDGVPKSGKSSWAGVRSRSVRHQSPRRLVHFDLPSLFLPHRIRWLR